MVGQSNLLKTIDGITNFPRSIILIGDQGCGKDLLIDIISNKLNLNKINLTSIDSEIINNILISSIPYIYIIDGDNLDIKQQNILLKTIEEPLNNSYFIIKTEYKYNLINTLLNRCLIFKFEDYNKSDLISFIPDKYKDKTDILVKIFNTPGKLINLNTIDFDSLFEFCDKFVNKLNVASLANTLTISNKINYDDTYDKYDINLLFDTIIYLTLKYYNTLNDIKFLKLYEVTLKYKYNLKNKKYNKEQLMLSYLLTSWKSVKNINEVN